MKKGFTLIELLVVIAIIGVLATVVLTSLQQARIKARDSSRKQSLVNLRNALELYYAKNGVYPSTGGTYYTSSPLTDPGYFAYGPGNAGDWIPGLVASGAISALPQDPLAAKSTNAGADPIGTSCLVFYRAFNYMSTNGSGYVLLSHCAPEGTVSATDTFYDPQRPTTSWKVCAGANCAN